MGPENSPPHLDPLSPPSSPSSSSRRLFSSRLQTGGAPYRKNPAPHRILSIQTMSESNSGNAEKPAQVSLDGFSSTLGHEHGLESSLGADKVNEAASIDCMRFLLQYGSSRQVTADDISSVCRKLGKETCLQTEDGSLSGELKELVMSRDIHALPKSNSLAQRLSRLYFHDDSNNDSGECSKSTATESFSATPPSEPDNIAGQENTDESSKPQAPAKTEMCRYFTMPGGCVRGEKCFYAHGEETLMRARALPPGDTRHGLIPKHFGGTKIMLSFLHCSCQLLGDPQRVTEDLSKKIFVGGLSPSVESDDLWDFFEEKYGPVLDAVVIGSQSGDHLQSRGFGFVTFKHVESVAAAVEAHYINIFGKKVEIKSAVPRSELPALDSARSDSNIQEQYSPLPADKMSEVDRMEFLTPSTPGSLLHSKTLQGTPQAHWMTLVECQQPTGEDNTSFSNKLSSAKEFFHPSDLYSSPVSQSSSSSIQGSTPSWLIKFRQWLPTFLAGVSTRLNEGEWYPLSSLKGDFRATCGLELDHLALGYEKLSDFIRSLPEVCRMKIVPVGRGPATHMVLLPALTRPTPVSQSQGRTSGSLMTSRSLVDASRSYAAVACQGASHINSFSLPYAPTSLPHIDPPGVVNNEGAERGESASPSAQQHPAGLECYKGLSLVDATRSYAAVACRGTSSLMGAALSSTSLPSNKLPTLTTGVATQVLSHPELMNDAPKCPGSSSSAADLASLIACKSSTVQVGTKLPDAPHASGINSATVSQEEWTFLAELLALLHKNEIGQDSEDVPKITTSDPSVQNSSQRPAVIGIQVPQGSCSQRTEVRTSARLPVTPEHEPQTPDHQLPAPLKPFAAFSHSFPSFLPDTPYSIWGPNVQDNRAKEVYNHQEFAQSILPLYGIPSGLPPALGQGYSGREGMCGLCSVRQALWVAVPCGHYGLCAACKDSLRQRNHAPTQCFLCYGYVERWIALH